MSQAPSIDPSTQEPTPKPPASVDDSDAWAFCWQRLLEVSRTFSRPIELLPDELRAATTCGYLLCRIADTIEDDATLGTCERDRLFGALLDVLENNAEPETFTEEARVLKGDGPEEVLARNLDRVLAVFYALPEPMQRACSEWTCEMIRGMNLYAHRTPTVGAGPDERSVITLSTLDDLERYCYFVAGTVGQLLTGIFCHALPELTDDRKARMQANAEAFGLGLQMVNILKDQTDDLARGWCFIPKTLWRAQGLEPAQMLDDEHREAAHAAVEPVFERARVRLDQALEYTLAIPPEAPGVRLFCLLPLWMAVRTLVFARGNDAMFVEGEAVKISREEVGRLIGEASQSVGDDTALRAQYAALWRRE